MLVVPILPHPPSATPAVLNILFEPSAALRSVVAAAAPPPEFATYAELVEWATARIADLPRDDPRLLDILSAHPRLGATAVDSAASRDEQASLRAGQADELRTLNELYERTFPGLRYVVFVNARPRAAIVADMTARIARGDIALEKQEAIAAMRDIALDRAAKFTAA